MCKRILFFGFWGVIFVSLLWVSVSLGFSWVLFLYTPLFFAAVVSAYDAMWRKTTRSRLIAGVIDVSSLLIALGLALFIDEIFDYDGGGMFPGFAYLTERLYSWLAIVTFGVNFCVLSIVFLIQKKHPVLAVLIAGIEALALAVFLLASK